MFSTIVLFALVASALVPVLALQVPPGSGHNWQDAILDKSVTQSLMEWDLHKFPSPDDTDHLVFETVYSLLQHWPNTRMRNGHNIIPGVIQKGTLLYHGTNTNALPPGLDWVGTDPEHSYLFCRDELQPVDLNQGCWHLTFAAIRALKVIYFDGNSAANMPTGTTDTQELIMWGRTYPGGWRKELQLAQDLCTWGSKFGVDAFVRMEMDFEFMLCNFTQGLSLVSSAKLHSRGVPPMQPGWVSFEVIEAGSWHNRFPGETRIQLDLAGLVSFYDTQLVPSLVAVRAGQERWDHRVQSTSSGDLVALKSRLEAALVRPDGLSSGIDWKTLIQVIVDRFSGRLELARHLLNSSTTDPNEIFDLAKKIQTQLRVVLTPYILFSAVPTNPSDKTDMDWARPIYRLCATTHTHYLEPELDSEKLLLRAVRGTSREICRVVTRMWTAGVYAGIDSSLNTKEFTDISEVSHVWRGWEEDLNRLMAWLDWSVWVKCNPDCGPEEMCYLPTWPLNLHRHRRSDVLRLLSVSNEDGTRPEGLPNGINHTEVWEPTKLEQSEWDRPQPKCIRRIAPHEY